MESPAVIETELSVSAPQEVQPKVQVWWRKQLGARLTSWFSQRQGNKRVAQISGHVSMKQGPGENSLRQRRKKGRFRVGQGGKGKLPGQVVLPSVQGSETGWVTDFPNLGESED